MSMHHQGSPTLMTEILEWAPFMVLFPQVRDKPFVTTMLGREGKNEQGPRNFLMEFPSLQWSGWNKRLKRKKGVIGQEKKTPYGLGVSMESGKKSNSKRFNGRRSIDEETMTNKDVVSGSSYEELTSSDNEEVMKCEDMLELNLKLDLVAGGYSVVSVCWLVCVGGGDVRCGVCAVGAVV
ncbi:hypothetical protein IFM89_029853 [Coptis chinensis]|uniref:Uncharacterized protein n=1 Tax=Coptis chinensis TaxID=261450 RepID=A0A835HQ58_9MAGN|nr:hypothetical protein IFM89_029853 [Coptis chinensis]